MVGEKEGYISLRSYSSAISKISK